MKITDVICSKGLAGLFFDDQQAIRNGAVHDGATYKGTPVTEGFQAIRMPGESISVLLRLEDGQIAHGDCVAVQYSGAGGRDPLFLADRYIDVLEKYVTPVLHGKELGSFRKLAAEIENIEDTEKGGKLHTAIRYGVTQAILDAVARKRKKLMAEVIAEEYGVSISSQKIPIFSQTGDDRYVNADKMILKRVDVLPHGLFNSIECIGEDGEKLIEYLRWLSSRIKCLAGDESYNPIIHIDVYGTIGIVFKNNIRPIVDYFRELERAASPYRLRIEGPVDMGDQKTQVTALRELTAQVQDKGMGIEIVVDEWCNTLEDIQYFADNQAGHMLQIKTPDLGGIHNTIEAVIYCREKGIGAYLGGSANETERSAQICAHIAMATGPDQILAKPGFGCDEGIMIVNNEMARILMCCKQ